MSKSSKKFHIILDVDRVLVDTERYYETDRTEIVSYPEDKGALEKLKKMASLSVLSEITVNGTREIQELKLKTIKIVKHIPKKYIHITENKIEKLPEIIKKYKKDLLFLIDDRIEVLEAAKKIDPEVFTIWMQRGIHAKRAMESPRIFEADAFVPNLSKATDIAKDLISGIVE